MPKCMKSHLWPPTISKMVEQELTLKCKLKFYVKPMKDPLGVSPSKGNQGTRRVREETLLASVGILFFDLRMLHLNKMVIMRH